MGHDIVDALIIGGGPAGLSAALSLYRALHTCIIIDSNSPRNKYSTPVHLTLAWENRDPAALRSAAREELLATGLVTFEEAVVKMIEKTETDLFRLRDEQGREWLGRTVLLSYGAEDILPDIKGFGEMYTRSIFPCMFQFGYELRGRPSGGLLAIDGLANADHASMLADDGHKFTETMTIYTNDNSALANEISQSIKDPEMRVDNRKISSLSFGTQEGEAVIEFEGGESAVEGFLIHRPLTKVSRLLPNQLGLEFGSMGGIKVAPPFNRTSHPLVYAAGDCATPMKAIPNVMSMGAYAAAGMARDLPKRVTGNNCK